MVAVSGPDALPLAFQSNAIREVAVFIGKMPVRINVGTGLGVEEGGVPDGFVRHLNVRAEILIFLPRCPSLPDTGLPGVDGMAVPSSRWDFSVRTLMPAGKLQLQ
jgi:hypothetical protein